jgi:hypothetical protein
LLLDFPAYDTVDRRDTIHDSLQQVASINLKKSTGGSSADLTVINAYAWQDRNLLREQIEQIDATTIVACGTFNELIWLLDLPVKPDSPREVVSVAGKYRVIPWIHPSRCDNRKSYEQLHSLARVSNTR